MCDRIPEHVFPPRRIARRAFLAGTAVLVGACVPLPTVGRPACVTQAPTPPTRTAPRFRVFTRADWGAEPLKDNHDPMNGVERITLHHTTDVPGMDTHTNSELVKGIQSFHRNDRGWADIGYHWLIGLDGNVYEGRTLEAQGAHAGAGHNENNLGISVIGDFSTALPEGKQLATLELFLAQQLAKYRIQTDELYGHRDFTATKCPGESLYTWLTSFKETRATA